MFYEKIIIELDSFSDPVTHETVFLCISYLEKHSYNVNKLVLYLLQRSEEDAEPALKRVKVEDEEEGEDEEEEEDLVNNIFSTNSVCVSLQVILWHKGN